MTQQLSYDHLRRHPFWQVQGVFDPDGEGGDFAYTIGLHDRGFPELHVWARPTLGEDPGLDWMFSMRDRTILLNELAALMLTGGLEVGTELEHDYDGGLVTVHFRVDPPGDRDELEAFGIAPGAEVLPVRWSLHRAPDGQPAPLAPDQLRVAQVDTKLLRRMLDPTAKAPRGWELPDPPHGPWTFDPDQRHGPLTPLVQARAAQFWQADDDTLATALDLALALDDAHALGHASAVAVAAARPVGRRVQLERLHDDVHELVLWLTERPAAGRRWRKLVSELFPSSPPPSKRERLRRQGRCARVLANLLLGCLLTDAVSDVADDETIATGRGPWLAVFEEPDHPDLWAPEGVLREVTRLLRPLDALDLLRLGMLHDEARQDEAEPAGYPELAVRLTAWSVTGSAVCPWEGCLAELSAWWSLTDALEDACARGDCRGGCGGDCGEAGSPYGWCRGPGWLEPGGLPVGGLQRWATCLTAALTHRSRLSPADVGLLVELFGPLVPGLAERLVDGGD